MASGGEVGKEAIVSAIQELRDTQYKLLSDARNDVQESVEQFVNEKIVKLFGLASAFNKTLKRLESQTKGDMERKFQQHFRYPEVRDAYDDWQELESEWDTLLKDVDAQLEKSGPQPLTEGQVMKLDQPLVDARTGKAACLEDLFAPAAASCASEQSSHSQASKASSSSSPAWPPDRTVSSEATCLVLILLRHFA